VTEIYDVSHNPASIEFLKKRLQQIPCAGKTYAVFSMLADKDIIGSLTPVKEVFDHWFVAPLKIKIAATKEVLEESFRNAEINNVTYFQDIEEAYYHSRQLAQPGDRIIVFGSFHTITDVWKEKSSS
jgi:dihydrofolate synthase/folylpolyglutamate synthase